MSDAKNSVLSQKLTVKSKLRKISVQAYENMAKTGEYLWLFCIFTLTLQSAKISDVPKKEMKKFII